MEGKIYMQELDSQREEGFIFQGSLLLLFFFGGGGGVGYGILLLQNLLLLESTHAFFIKAAFMH